MKKQNLLSGALCALLLSLSACSNEDELQTGISTEDVNSITMTAADFEYPTTRTDFEIGSSGAAFKWAANDTVGIFPNEGSQVYFPMTSGAGTNSATFTGGGWALKSSATYAAYYPFIGNMYLDQTKIPVSYTEQTQTGNGSTAHLGAYDFMAASATTPENGGVNFTFKHLGCLVQLKITVPNAGTLSSVTLSADEEVFVEKGYIDLTTATPTIVSTQTASSLNINLKDVTTTATNEVVTVYFMMAPVDMTGKTLTVTIIDGYENENILELETKNFEAGKAYSMSMSLNPLGSYSNGKAHVTIAGSLPKLIGDENKYDISSLVVSGDLNGTDIKYLQEMSKGNGTLTYLDMSEANIVSGGQAYSYYTDSDDDDINLYTNNNEFGRNMFANCKLTEIILPKSIVSIGKNALGGSRINIITIPEKVNSIFSSTWIKNQLTEYRVDENNLYFSTHNGVLYNKNKTELISCPSKLASTNYTIPEGVTSIMSSAFSGCTGLTSIVIPNNLKSIESYAFSDCSNLASIDLPESMAEIGNYAFSYCTNLTRITMPKTMTGNIGKYAFEDCKKLTSIVLPDGITYISERTFSYCTSLTSVTIPEGVKSISIEAFYNCSKLSSINIPESLDDYISSQVFYECESLTDFNTKNISKIGSYAFWNCRNLTSITFGENIAYINNYAFLNCENLSSIKCSCKVPPTIYPLTFYNISTSCIVYVPSGYANAYKTADYWKEFTTFVEIME